jgi:hypothetical protein
LLNQIEGILPTLAPGEAVMFVMPRKQGDVASFFRVKIDYTELKLGQSRLDSLIRRMKEKYKVTEKNDDVLSIINPIFDISKDLMR